LNEAHDARLLLETELGQARGALTDARGQIASLMEKLDRVEEAASEASEAAEAAETAMAVEQTTNEESAARMAELEGQLALARATAERLAEKEALASAELYLRRREYRDIVAGGEDAIVGALATRDQALATTQTQLDYMRRDLSMLTSAGAQLAVTLEQRNHEYDNLRNRLVAERTDVRALPEVSLASAAAMPKDEDAAAPAAAPAAEAGPDLQAELEARAAELDELKQEYDELKAALDQAIAERDDLQNQFDARLGDIEALNGKVADSQQALQAVAAEKDDLLNRLAARAAIINKMLNKIGDFDEELRSIVPATEQTANHGAATTAQPVASAATTQEEEGETHAS
jgi:chromosome segregation ATPase